jgi:hypothetical protein
MSPFGLKKAQVVLPRPGETRSVSPVASVIA